VKRIVNEPTAAALAYGLDKKKDETIAVYDFGGGTFDISILEVGEGVIEVKSPTATPTLGRQSRPAHRRVADCRVQAGAGLDLASKGNEMACSGSGTPPKAKIELSTTIETEINLPFVTADASGPKHLVRKLTRAKLEQLVEDLLNRSLEPCKKAIADAGVALPTSTKWSSWAPDAHAQNSGDSQKMFAASRIAGSTRRGGAIGAAVQAGVLGGEVKDLLLLDVTR